MLILPQRQTVLVAKQAAELAILSGNRFRLGIGIGWNAVEYVGLNETFTNRGRRQAEQVELMRRLWTEDSVLVRRASSTRSTRPGSTRARPSRCRSGSAARRRPLLERCARLGDGWVPLGTPNDAVARAAGDDPPAPARRPGGRWTASPSRRRRSTPAATPSAGGTHADRWRELGATHLAIATHNAGPTDVDGHLRPRRRVPGRSVVSRSVACDP